MSLSPYSLSHDWSLHWTRIPSNIKRSSFGNGESPKERKALEALAAVGLIGGYNSPGYFLWIRNGSNEW